MKKIFLAFMIMVLLCPCSFAAENDDVYVRKDLLDAYMKNIDTKFDQVFAKLDTIMKDHLLIREDIKNLTKSVSELSERVSRLDAKVDGISMTLSHRINGVEKRFDDLRTDVNIGIALIGLIVVILGLPVVQKWWREHGDSKRKYLTAEDVERLIEVRMRGNLSSAAL